VDSKEGADLLWLLVVRVASSQGFELVELERVGGKGQQIIRVFIDKPGGVDLADCARLSRELGECMEDEGIMDSSFVLEVSSPGIERPLRKASDFERYTGNTINVRLRKRLREAGKLHFSGILRCIKGEIVTVDLDGGEERSFSLNGIAKAKLKVDWDPILRGEALQDGSSKLGRGGMNR